MLVEKLGVQLIVGSVQESIDKGRAKEETGADASRNALTDCFFVRYIRRTQSGCCYGRSRRDEEKARAKERFFSHRDEFGQWDPKNQRPELWNLFNGRKNYGEHFRVFPISNWTEMDVWEYIKLENIDLPSLYFSHQRDCVVRDGVILANSEFIKLKPGEEVVNMTIRYRTCGDMPITGAVESEADDLTK